MVCGKILVVLNTARDESWVLLPRLSPGLDCTSALQYSTVQYMVLLPRLSPAQSASAPIQTIQIQSVNDAEKFDPSHENNATAGRQLGLPRPCWGHQL